MSEAGCKAAGQVHIHAALSTPVVCLEWKLESTKRKTLGDFGVAMRAQKTGLTVTPVAVCGRGRNWVGRTHMSAQARSHREEEG